VRGSSTAARITLLCDPSNCGTQIKAAAASREAQLMEIERWRAAARVKTS
jgi:hypothetical protein